MNNPGDRPQEGTKAELGRILNKDLFLYLLDFEVKKARRYQNFLCLLLLDLKQSSGNEDGNGLQACQMRLGNLLKEEIRETDLLGSFGDNKLVVLLPYADTSVGGIVKARFEGTLKYYDFKGKGYQVNIDQVCFPVNGTNAIDLVRTALGT